MARNWNGFAAQNEEAKIHWEALEAFNVWLNEREPKLEKEGSEDEAITEPKIILKNSGLNC